MSITQDFELQSKFKPSPDQREAIDLLSKGTLSPEERQTLLGVTGSGKTFVMANMINELNRPTLILSHNKTLAAQLYEEFKEFFPNNAVKYFVSYYDYYQPEAYLPGKDIFIEKESQVNQEIERFRLSSMNAAVTRRDTIVIASVSCIYNIGNPDDYADKSTELEVGKEYPLGALARQLVLMQYQRDMTDFVPGSFRVKGDTVDVFMPYTDFPVRLEFFGDELEAIHYIDGLTGHKLQKLDKVEIFPSKSFVFDFEVIGNAVKEIRKDLDKRIKYYKNMGRELEAQRIQQRTEYDLEMLLQLGYCKGMENYSSYFEGRAPGEPPFTLMDYFPDDYLFFIDESHITLPQVGGMSGGDRARKENLVQHGFRLPSAMDNRPLNAGEFKERMGTTVYVSATPGPTELGESKQIVELLTRPTGLLDPIIEVKPSENQIDDVIEQVNATIAKGQRVLITTLTKKMSEDLTDYLKELGVKVQYLHSGQDTVERVDVLRSLRLGEYDVVVGINLLREGLDLPEVSLILILDADKEGFLRSKTSLVQTIGRAARHKEGKVIMYADKYTDSMKFALSETKRRREYQEKYNKKHGITPKSIQKDIRDKLVDRVDKAEVDYKQWIKDSKPPANEIRRLVKELEDKMFIAAQNLQFEKAADLRDQLKDLKG